MNKQRKNIIRNKRNFKNHECILPKPNDKLQNRCKRTTQNLFRILYIIRDDMLVRNCI